MNYTKKKIKKSSQTFLITLKKENMGKTPVTNQYENLL